MYSDYSLLLDVFFASIFSLSVACLLLVLTLSLAEQSFLFLIKSNLQITSFMDYVVLLELKMSLPNPRSSKFFSMLSSRVFVVLHLAVRSIIHFS